MDELARFNQDRWQALAEAGIVYARPLLDLDAAEACAVVDEEGVMPPVRGRDVLCLAAGGGQQSAAFGVLGAHVTVLDLTPAQLDADRAVAAHYGFPLTAVAGDMRDLRAFADDCFDLVWHAYSINFVPDVAPVFDEVARVLRPGGVYRMQAMNPFFAALDETGWDGQGYRLQRVYGAGELEFDDDHWEFEDAAGQAQSVLGPREFSHTLQTLTRGLADRGFCLWGIWERPAGDPAGDPAAAPGAWEHFLRVAPPWLTVWAGYHPEQARRSGDD